MTEEGADTGREPRIAAPDAPEGLLLSEPCAGDHPALEPAGFLIDRWREARLRDPGKLPSRSLFAPETLGGLMGRVSLLEPVDGATDFRYRIHAGTAADVARLDLSGRLVSDLPYPEYGQAVIGQYASALASRELRFDRIRLNWFGTIYDYVRVTMPIADEASDRALVLSVMLHTDTRRPHYASRFRPAAIDAEWGDTGRPTKKRSPDDTGQ